MPKNIFIALIVLFLGCAPKNISIKESLADLQAQLKNDPNNETTHYNLAVKYLTLEIPDSAISHFKEATELNPVWAEPFFGIYCAEIMKNNSYTQDSVQQSYLASLVKEAWMLNPLFDWRLGCTLIKKPRHKAGDSTMISIGWEVFVKPYVSFIAGKFKNAIAEFNDNPFYGLLFPTEKYHILAICYAKSNEFDKAIGYIDSIENKLDKLSKKYFLVHGFETPELYYLKAKLYEEKQEYNLAIENYQTAVVNGLPDDVAHFQLAKIYHKMGDLNNEKDALEFAAFVKRDKGIYHYNLACFYLAKGNVDKATSEFLKTKDLLPKYSKTYLNLALIYEATGNKENALKYYKEFINRASSEYKDKIDMARQKIENL